jgi:metal-responsive CopG/Arc/MetJ family transcriptional regulator
VPKADNLLKSSTIQEVSMATVNFSVPDEVKEAFNNAYHGQNKSAIIADLMREAVERFERKQRHRDACKSILALRQQMPPISSEEAQAARDELRGS